MQRLIAALTTAVCLSAAPLMAQEPGRIAVQTDTLANGLTVILAPDHSAQVVAVDVWYNVGSRNEVRGRTGFAHLFEHMMFQGSAHVKKAEHFQLVQRAGGAMNGSTTEDRTNYFEVLPSNRLNLGLWLEADRMRSLAVNDSNFHNQREAVKEERRLRVDNQPYTRVLFEDAYGIYDSTSCFPYAHSVIGSMDDLNAAETNDVKEFHDLYYAPNNATLTIVGDFDPAQAKQLVQQYFANIPRSPEPPAVQCTPRFNTGPMRRTATDAKATLPAAFHVFRVPAYESPDYPALQLLSTILGQGESSRLNVRLARDAKAAVATQVLLNPFGPRRGPGLMYVFAIANQGVPIDSVDGLLSAEIARVGSEGVTDAELTKAKNQLRASTINQRQQSLSRAEALQRANMFLGDANAVNTDLDRYMKVTTADVKRVAGMYLRPDNSLILIVTPEAKP
ncbi:MAG TPA: pitrilysin family protein [Gemmatimonadaceae bacterium]|nr:pitrilysin family protein [Gemmatimonadaceae bacterium]